MVIADQTIMRILNEISLSNFGHFAEALVTQRIIYFWGKATYSCFKTLF